MSKSLVLDKSKKFSVRIVRMAEYVQKHRREHVMSKQVYRSGTSIGANISEALSSISRREFLSKMYISLKECRETLYWIELMHETGYLNDKEFTSVYTDCSELYRMLSAIASTTSRNMANNR